MVPFSRNKPDGGKKNSQGQPSEPMNELPPSTLAAQLVNNISTASRPFTHDSSQEDYQRLLEEISRYEDSSNGNLSADEKLQRDHKLIYVVAQGVLEVVTKEDPFAQVQEQLLRAQEALQFLVVTIKETPAVLAHILGPGANVKCGIHEPLWLWLFPRLLALVGRQRCEPLYENISSFFFTAFEAVSRSPQLWQLGLTFVRYLKECTDAILASLQDADLLSADSVQSVDLIIPSVDIVDRIPELASYDIHLDTCSYAIRSVTHGLQHIGHLLLMITELSTLTSSSYRNLPTVEDYRIWILDSIVLKMEIEHKWQFDTQIRDHMFTDQFLSLKTVNKILLSTEGPLPKVIERKALMILVEICAELLKDGQKLSEEHYPEMFSVFTRIESACKQYDTVIESSRAYLLPSIQSLLSIKLDSQPLESNFKARITSLAAQLSSGMIDLTSQTTQLELADNLATEEQLRPSKRRKLLTDISHTDRIVSNASVVEAIHSEIYALVGGQENSDMSGLSKSMVACYDKLSEEDRCNAIKLLGQVPCASSGTLTLARDDNGVITEGTCIVCDESRSTENPCDMDYSSEAFMALSNLLDCPTLADSRRPRILAMLTLQRFVLHLKDARLLDVESSPLLKWCISSLQSSMRELRIAAGRTISSFLKIGQDDPNYRQDRINVFDILRTLSDKSTMPNQETYVLAWGQTGRVVKDEELNLVLHRLVEYLGHSNLVVHGVAFTEILNIAQAAKISARQLLSPYWRTIATTAIKDLQTRPALANKVADLIGVTVDEFLLITQKHTLPWLVLMKKRDVILRIAKAREEDGAGTLMLDNSNLSCILALLLVQNVPDLEGHTMSLFREVSPNFNDTDLVDLFRIEPIKLAFELLKAAGEANDSKKSRVRNALNFLASHSHQNPGESSRGKTHSLVDFIEQNTMGLMAYFSDFLNDTHGWQPTAEKKLCLKAMEEMIRIGKSEIYSGLPQICACLQSSLQNKDLRSTAFTTWATMAMLLEDEDLETILENTITAIIQHWEAFDTESRNRACSVIEYIFIKKKKLITECIDIVPSLATIPELSKFDKEFEKRRSTISVRQRYQYFRHRIGHENAGVVLQALSELGSYLRKHQSFLQASATSEQPDNVVGELLRALLDVCVRFDESHVDISRLSAECMGLIGSVDPNRVECVRERREMIVVSNFEDPGDTTDFVLFLLKEVLVKAFLSASTIRTQGYLSYAMQQLLLKCDFSDVVSIHRRPGDHSSTDPIYKKWLALPDLVRTTLTPFLKTKYSLPEMVRVSRQYPIYEKKMKFGVWLRAFVLDLLQNPQNDNAALIFPPLCRIINIQDHSVADFLLPYVVLHVAAGGPPALREQVGRELLHVLKSQPSHFDSHFEKEHLRLCSEAIFRVLDYLSRWVQEKTLRPDHPRASGSRWSSEQHSQASELEIEHVSEMVSMIPAEVIAKRSVEAGSHARALFYWEQHIRAVREDPNHQKKDVRQKLSSLQDMYAQIDDPDAIEGLSAQLHVLDINQQVLGHRKAGRWNAAQTWYEIKLAEDPTNVHLQVNLLQCLKESGQHDVLLNHVEGMHQKDGPALRLIPFAAEASWASGRWATLEKYLSMAPQDIGGHFDVNIGHALLALRKKDTISFANIIQRLRETIAGRFSQQTTTSIQEAHIDIRKFHVLTELEMIANTNDDHGLSRKDVLESLDRRLEVIGAYLNDKQYLLNIRRAAMQLTGDTFTKGDISSAWLTSARLARKGNSIHQSFNAVLHASQLGDDSATIEHARLLWKEGNSRQAIQNLEAAITTNAFISHNRGPADGTTSFGGDGTAHENLLIARSHLLLAKWLDSAGQTNSNALRSQYQHAAKTGGPWEKGHYYLGRHYNKLLESDRALPAEHQAQPYLTGETARLIIENYLRSLNHGTKYIYQTLPRILTLWLDLGTKVNEILDTKYGNRDFAATIQKLRGEELAKLHAKLERYIAKMPAYIFYTALPQIVARIAHPNEEVYKHLQSIIVKVVAAHPQQALWSLLAVSRSMQKERRTRGTICMTIIRNGSKKNDPTSPSDLKTMIRSGERLSDQLLMVCNAGEFSGNRTVTASITRDLGFNHKTCTPSPLAVPVESSLIATLPTLTDGVRTHKAFSRDVVTITSFLDDVLILSSLAKPRKLTARASDGKTYGLLCKPKDDLRKDQRLMEFNSMINRSLKKDAESSKRQLYIKTYAVTPLNEECGIIEWVDGLKTLRDILLALYKSKGITPNYHEIKVYLDQSVKSEENITYFTDKVLSTFPPIFYLWFIKQFPEPSAWFAARLRYTRSCAVMSMVGTILGLGDRHGENILFEEGNGGTFHVDFNCLFDKGLTFAQPERVPFRLTHNMVDAMGVYGYEGPFRKSSELTLSLLRQNEETLMTILEAFVYDPTLDLIKKGRERKKDRGAVPDTPQGVLQSIRRKVRGLLAGESVPLGVEGQVQELISQAVDPRNLAAMYIGWCAFF